MLQVPILKTLRTGSHSLPRTWQSPLFHRTGLFEVFGSAGLGHGFPAGFPWVNPAGRLQSSGFKGQGVKKTTIHQTGIDTLSETIMEVE